MALKVRQLFFFPAVTVVFCGGCLAFLEDFSVMFPDYSLCDVCVAITYLYSMINSIIEGTFAYVNTEMGIS